MEDVADHRAAGITVTGLAVIVMATLAALFLTPPAQASSATLAGNSRSCTSQASPEPSTQTIDVEGVARQYRVAMPEPGSGKGLRPLIVNFHGFGGSVRATFETHDGDAVQAAYSQLEEKGPARGFVVITPNAGSPPFWDSRLTEPDFREMSDANLAFTTALIDTAAADLCVDLRRVYVTGFSNGAGATAYLGCTLSRQIAAIAPVAGVNLAAPCPRGKPVPVLAFHGMADPVVPYEGGSQQAVCCPDIDLLSVEAAVQAWAQRAECPTTPSSKSIGTEVERIAYRGCGSAADVVLYKVANGAHNWPGSFELGDLGLPTQDINAADLILDFFSQHPRPAKNGPS